MENFEGSKLHKMENFEGSKLHKMESFFAERMNNSWMIYGNSCEKILLSDNAVR